MDHYDKLIENPLFFRWIYHPGPEINSWWETYLSLNPEDAPQILLLKQRFGSLGYSVEKLSAPEKQLLAKRIMMDLESIERNKQQRQFFIGLAKYVAIAVLFFSIGSVLVYLQMDKKSAAWMVADNRIPQQLQGPVLILPEGKSVPLKKSTSSLDYTNPEQVVLNNDSVIHPQKKVDQITTNQLIIPFGNRSKLTLGDGSVVWLNAGSRLIYPSAFSGNSREVILFGEAFFDVARNENNPFVVKTSSLEVIVLGTKFNISAYPEDNVIQTVLKEGSVSIRRNGSGFFENDLILTPNQMASFDKTTQDSKVSLVDAGAFIIWTEGLLRFDDLEMCRILKSVERYYNIHIQYADPMVGSQRITGKLDLNNEVEQVFEYITKVSSVRFTKIDENNYQIK